jgi:hypothetical protein
MNEYPRHTPEPLKTARDRANAFAEEESRTAAGLAELLAAKPELAPPGAGHGVPRHESRSTWASGL